jgi:hypothetical protein
MNLYRHKKTGKVYILLMTAHMEKDSAHVCVYQRVGHDDKNDNTWVRPASEFFDGRFEAITRVRLEGELDGHVS